MEEAKISLEDLIIAFRKVKVDSFYETGHVTAVDFAEYEQNLFENLNTFLEKFNIYDEGWFTSPRFVGNHRYALKKVEFERNAKTNKKKEPFIYFSKSERDWNRKEIKEIDYRIIGKHSVDFHVLSSLWLEKVGYKFDALISDNSYGCRIKGIKKAESDLNDIGIDRNAHGHFKPYIHNYQRWQRNGLEAISGAIKANKKVIAITTDLAKYYHRIEPGFLLNEEFLKLVSIKLSPLENKITQLLIDAIRAWSHNVYENKTTPVRFKYNDHSGIPMGLGASKVIANILLWQLDKEIETEIRPIYYGRYVDDIFIVLEDVGTITNPGECWMFMVKRLTGLRLTDEKSKKSKNKYQPQGWTYPLDYAKNSLIEFSKSKEKYFFLEGSSGELFLTVLKESLDENSSEWNLPPDINNDIDAFSDEVSKVTTDNQESANGLRKSDGISIQRLKFVLYLKRLELVVRYFPVEKWQKPFNSFINLCIEHAITPDTIATYTKYYPRVIGLCVSLDKMSEAEHIIHSIEKAFDKLALKSKNEQKRIEQAQKLMFEQIEEAIICNLNPNSLDEPTAKNLWSALNIQKTKDLNIVCKVIATDLHRNPFKDYVLKQDKNLDKILIENFVFNSNYQVTYSNAFKDREGDALLFSNTILCKFEKLKYFENIVPNAFLFYTRPFTLYELSELIWNWYELTDFIRFCSLFNIDYKQIHGNCPIHVGGSDITTDLMKCICLNSGEKTLDKTVAFTSLETKENSWLAVVQEHGIEPDSNRVERIFRLVEDILRCKLYDNKKIHYVLFPELSIPRDLLSYISYLFLKKGISVIAGVEYKITPNLDQINLPHITNFVSNQLIYVLTVQGQYQNSHVIIKQEKEIPALQEERDLYNMGGALLRYQSNTKYIINHDAFYFTGLICNDFLDINNRAKFRGLIDALIVIEWNKDTNTYNALVEATANDLHACIMQVNNRQYGDTRLRIPYKEDYMKDAVRVKGGELDYFVVATLPVTKLREFQRHHRSPEGHFKPVPTGYSMSIERRKL